MNGETPRKVTVAEVMGWPLLVLRELAERPLVWLAAALFAHAVVTPLDGVAFPAGYLLMIPVHGVALLVAMIAFQLDYRERVDPLRALRDAFAGYARPLLRAAALRGLVVVPFLVALAFALRSSGAGERVPLTAFSFAAAAVTPLLLHNAGRLDSFLLGCVFADYGARDRRAALGREARLNLYPRRLVLVVLAVVLAGLTHYFSGYFAGAAVVFSGYFIYVSFREIWLPPRPDPAVIAQTELIPVRVRR